MRIRALVKDGFDMQAIKNMFSEAEEKTSSEVSEEIEMFMECIEELKFDVAVSDDDISIVYYYAGYIVRSRLRAQSCTDCVKMISSDTKSFSAEVAEEEYSASITRGGLCKPSDILFITACHAWTMWCYIRDNEDVKQFFWDTRNQKCFFVESFIRNIEEVESINPIFVAKCSKGHDFRPLIRRIAGSLFNCAAANRAKEMNSIIHAEKKRIKQIQQTKEKL